MDTWRRSREHPKAGEVVCKAQMSGSVQGICGTYFHITNEFTKIHGGAIIYPNGKMYVTK